MLPEFERVIKVLPLSFSFPLFPPLSLSSLTHPPQKVRNGKHNDAMGELVGKLKQVGQKSFVDFEDEVKKDNLKMLPVDGTVHELTSNVCFWER